jgi:Pyridoxamine 5'-phosphate oxidase
LGVEDDEIVVASLEENRKVQNIRRDPRVSLSIETGRIATSGRHSGLQEYLVLHGQARIQEGGAAQLLQHLAYSYLGPHLRFPSMDNPPPGYVTRITPRRFGGVGPWANGGDE